MNELALGRLGGKQLRQLMLRLKPPQPDTARMKLYKVPSFRRNYGGTTGLPSIGN